MWKLQPFREKSHPLFPSNPPLKVEVLSSPPPPPPFWKFGWRIIWLGRCTLWSMPDWKGARLDKIQEFWLKSFTAAVHEVLGTVLNECTEVRDVPRWFIEERFILVMKDSNKDTEVGNYRPNACLNLIWKLLTGIISEKTWSFRGKQTITRRTKIK